MRQRESRWYTEAPEQNPVEHQTGQERNRSVDRCSQADWFIG